MLVESAGNTHKFHPESGLAESLAWKLSLPFALGLKVPRVGEAESTISLLGLAASSGSQRLDSANYLASMGHDRAGGALVISVSQTQRPQVV